MKEFLKKLFCKHRDVRIVRWCIKHIPDYEPSCVVVEYQCEKCGKYLYLCLYERDKSDWIQAMGEYKHEDFYSTR